MHNKFEYLTTNGLKIIYIKKEDFVTSYCGIGTKYGGSDVEFIFNDILYKSPSGIAHFIEHKLFSMPDQTDAFNSFNEMNAIANAYTTNNKTVYYFSTTTEIFEPLELLLKMYFTPFFTKENVETEKKIITSEIEMYDDKAMSVFFSKILQKLFPKDNFSLNVAGSKKDVNKTTKKQMQQAYEAFYTPQNSVLVIVSNIDEKELFTMIEKCLSGFNFKENKVIKLPTVKSKAVSKNFIHYDNVNQTMVSLGIRINNDNQNKLLNNYLMGILECLLSPSAKFYDELYQQKSFEAGIDYSINSSLDGSYILIQAFSNNPSKFKKLLQSKLQNILPSDLDYYLIELYLKHLKAKYYRTLDMIEAIGDEILSLELEDLSYFEEIAFLEKIKLSEFVNYLDLINHSQFVFGFLKKVKK